MTNEQAIEQLKGIRSDYEADCKNSSFKEMLYRKDIEALDLAIKALEDRLTGEWQVITVDNSNHHLYCSCCGGEATQTTNFCTICGAKMQEVKTC